MDHDYKSPRVQSKYIKQLKAILWVGRFYMIRLAHDDWTTISFGGFPEFAAFLGSLSSKPDVKAAKDRPQLNISRT